jgi:hypothetical protein
MVYVAGYSEAANRLLADAFTEVVTIGIVRLGHDEV